MTVWMYVDPIASMCSEEEADRLGVKDDGGMAAAVVLEYRNLEELFREAFPDRKIVFRRNMIFTELSNGCPDFYVWDIGGMCATDYSGSQRSNWCHGVLRQLEDHPSTGFVPWSSMTRQSVDDALMDMVLSPDDDIPDGYKRKDFPNLFMLDDDYDHVGVTDWMRRFHGDKQ